MANAASGQIHAVHGTAASPTGKPLPAACSGSCAAALPPPASRAPGAAALLRPRVAREGPCVAHRRGGSVAAACARRPHPCRLVRTPRCHRAVAPRGPPTGCAITPAVTRCPLSRGASPALLVPAKLSCWSERARTHSREAKPIATPFLSTFSKCFLRNFDFQRKLHHAPIGLPPDARTSGKMHQMFHHSRYRLATTLITATLPEW